MMMMMMLVLMSILWFSTFTLLNRHQKRHPPCENYRSRNPKKIPWRPLADHQAFVAAGAAYEFNNNTTIYKAP